MPARQLHLQKYENTQHKVDCTYSEDEEELGLTCICIYFIYLATISVSGIPSRAWASASTLQIQRALCEHHQFSETSLCRDGVMYG